MPDVTTIPDPRIVRELARKFLLDDDLTADELDYVVYSHTGYGVGYEEFQAWRDAVDADVQEATVTKVASWPGEQPQEFECEVCTKPITAYPCTLCEHEPDPWKKPEGEQPQDEQDVKPRIVCLCGSSKFRAEHDVANRELTMAGHIVLGLGSFSHSDGHAVTDAEKAALDKLHFAKIDLADEIFVVNPGGYIGTSTADEIAYATNAGKPVRYLVTLDAPDAKESER